MEKIAPLKPHLVIKLRRGVGSRIPHWGTAIGSKTGVPTRLLPSVDRVLVGFGAPVWITSEYPPAGSVWSREEIASGLNRIYRVILRRMRSIPAGLLEAIRVLPEVSWASIGRVGVSDLPRGQAMSRRTDRRSRRSIHLDEAHQLTRGDPRVTVAVLDTGIEPGHKELAPVTRQQGHDFVNIIPGTERFLGDSLGYDADPEDRWVGHGTHVAGIIAGQGHAMPMGVAPRCNILNVRVLGALERPGAPPAGAGLVDNIAVGLKWAVDQGADVINMSLGVRHEGGGRPYEHVVNYALSKGVVIVAASGNNGQEDLYYPGALPNVITVGATDDHDADVASFSTWGEHIDLVAPGSNIYSSYLNSGYAFNSGTSQAAPFVAGAAALLQSQAKKRGHRLNGRQTRWLLRHSADRFGRSYKHPRAGFGRLNVHDALQLLSHMVH